MANCKDVVRLFFVTDSAARYSYDKLCSLDTPIALLPAVHSGAGAAAVKTDEEGGLDSEVFHAEGTAVMLTSNPWQDVGLCNGASGIDSSKCSLPS